MNSLPCPFCSPSKNDIIFENALWYARWDAFPATHGHLLVIPYRHLTGYFDTTTEEQASLPEMLIECKKILDAEFLPAGYNIVINIGEAADQKVMHCHVHMIPRYSSDTDNTAGGIRGIVLQEPERVV
ncbi:MAG: HIT family protein [Methanoregula sp.]|nr:HIT family protein [Methanoregula sp.]